MKIITIPHPSLRKTAQTVTQVDDDLINFIHQLEVTLGEPHEPQGVGLAAPQVDKLLRIFTTNLPTGDDMGRPGDRPAGKIRHFINPIITKTANKDLVFGVDPQDADLEGCLSMPGVYGPVPRHQWVELEFQTLENDQLVDHQERFDDFAARVIQHEFDHLDGILFTDYSLEYDLPVYRLSKNGKQFVEIEKKLIEVI